MADPIENIRNIIQQGTPKLSGIGVELPPQPTASYASTAPTPNPAPPTPTQVATSGKTWSAIQQEADALNQAAKARAINPTQGINPAQAGNVAKGAGMGLLKKAGIVGAAVDVGLGITDLLQGKEQKTLTGAEWLSPMRVGMFAGHQINKQINEAGGIENLAAPNAPAMAATAPTTTPTQPSPETPTSPTAPTKAGGFYQPNEGAPDVKATDVNTMIAPRGISPVNDITYDAKGNMTMTGKAPAAPTIESQIQGLVDSMTPSNMWESRAKIGSLNKLLVNQTTKEGQGLLASAHRETARENAATRHESTLVREADAKERNRLHELQLKQAEAAGQDTREIRKQIAADNLFQKDLTTAGTHKDTGVFSHEQGLFDLAHSGMHLDRPEVQRVYAPFAARLKKAAGGGEPTEKQKKIALDLYRKEKGWQ
jgi:hypothetical protein